MKTPIDLNSQDEENYDWWAQFAQNRTSDDGTKYISNQDEDLVYLELISRAGEINCSTLRHLLADEVIPAPFAAEMILDLIPFHSEVIIKLELLQIGMSTVNQWPEVNYDGHWQEFLNTMWKTLEIVDECVKDSTHAETILKHFLNSELFWNEPIVLTSLVTLKEPSSKILEKLFSKFFSVWDFKDQSLKEDNALDLLRNELVGVAPLLAACVLSPNASLKDVHKMLEISTWEENSEFGLHFWDYICAFVSRGDGSSFWCPNVAWREGVFENGLWQYKTFLDSKLEVECLQFFVDAPSRIDFETVHGERITQRNVFQLLSKHAGADHITRDKANSILRVLEYFPILWRITRAQDENDEVVYWTHPVNGYTFFDFYTTWPEQIPEDLDVDIAELPKDSCFEDGNLFEALNRIVWEDQSIEIVLDDKSVNELQAVIEVEEETIYLWWNEGSAREEYYFESSNEGLTEALQEVIDRDFGAIQILYKRD